MAEKEIPAQTELETQETAINEEKIENVLNEKKSAVRVVWILAAVLLVLAIVIIWLIATCQWSILKKCSMPETPISQATPISTPEPQLPNELAGIVSLSGLVPDATASGEIHIFIRPFTTDGGHEFVDTEVIVPMTDNVPWEWDGATRGSNYEVMAGYVESGKTMKYSPIETVTAPALNLELDLNLDWPDVASVTQTPENIKIAGTVTTNGYVPDGSSVTLTALPADETVGVVETSFTTPWPAGAASYDFIWDKAALYATYQISAVLKDASGKVIGQQVENEIAQPGDRKLSLVINSTAQPPAAATAPPANPVDSTSNVSAVPQTAVLSGTVILNGPTNVGTSILILVRKPGEADYTPVHRIVNPDNSRQTWSWDQAEIGQHYEVTVALQVDNNNTSTPANSKIVTAPASDIFFNINTNFSVPAPSQTASAAVCSRDGDKWKTTLVFPAVAKAGNYWVQVGSQRGFSDVINQKFTAPAGDFSIDVRVDGGKEYFARYAYTYCKDCETDHNFSSFGQSLGFTCS